MHSNVFVTFVKAFVKTAILCCRCIFRIKAKSGCDDKCTEGVVVDVNVASDGHFAFVGGEGRATLIFCKT